MQKDKQDQFHEDLWKSQEEEQMQITTAEVRARALRYERENVRGYWILLALTPMLVAWIVYDVYDMIHLHKPLLVATTTWLLVTLCYMVWRPLRSGPRRMRPAEPCTQFLRREFEGRRQWALTIRRGILLLVPAVLAAWWGGGPTLRAKGTGIKATWLLRVHQPVALIVTILVLAFVWFAMGNLARKAEQEIEKLADC